MAPAVGDATTISDEEYLVLRAKDALKTDAFAAKAWMVTAKTLFPNNFAVQVRIFFQIKYTLKFINDY
jgi:integrator complex subunit 10